MERNYFLDVALLIFGFFFTWTPYLIVSMSSVIFGQDQSDLIAALFAKSTLVWTPVYISITSSYQYYLIFFIKNKFKKVLRNRNLMRSFITYDSRSSKWYFVSRNNSKKCKELFFDCFRGCSRIDYDFL